MRTRSWLIIIAFSMMGLAAKAALSIPSNMRESLFAPTNAVTNQEREIPMWSESGLARQNTFTNAVLSDNRAERGFADESVVVHALVAVPPEQERTETRVPEPATLVFVGTGLIVIRRLALRRKRDWKFRHLRMRIKATAAQEV